MSSFHNSYTAGVSGVYGPEYNSTVAHSHNPHPASAVTKAYQTWGVHVFPWAWREYNTAVEGVRQAFEDNAAVEVVVQRMNAVVEHYGQVSDMWGDMSSMRTWSRYFENQVAHHGVTRDTEWRAAFESPAAATATVFTGLAAGDVEMTTYPQR